MPSSSVSRLALMVQVVLWGVMQPGSAHTTAWIGAAVIVADLAILNGGSGASL